MILTNTSDNCHETTDNITIVDDCFFSLQIPSFDPVCSFDQIKSHTADQDEVTPEEDEDDEEEGGAFLAHSPPSRCIQGCLAHKNPPPP